MESGINSPEGFGRDGRGLRGWERGQGKLWFVKLDKWFKLPWTARKSMARLLAYSNPRSSSGPAERARSPSSRQGLRNHLI